MADIEKPGNEPGSGSENTTQYTRLPRYTPAAQLLTLLQEQHAIIRDCKPLTIGVHETVRASYPLFSRTAVRIALKFHTHSLTYRKNLAAGSHRYDLAGQPQGLITPEHQQQAQEKLAAKHQASKKERPASKPTPRGSEITNTARVETGDAAGPDTVVLRLKEMRSTLTLQKKGGCTMASGKNPTNGNGDKWAPSRINAPFEILQIQSLSSADLKVLLYLYSRDFKKKGKVWPGRKTIAEDTGCSERSVSRSISKLSALGIIRGEGGWRGNTTVYHLKYGDELRAAIKAIPSLAKKARKNSSQIRKAEGGKGAKSVALYSDKKGAIPVTLYSTKGCQIRSERVTSLVRKGAKLGQKGCQTRSQDTPQTRASTGFVVGECIKELYKEDIKGIVEGGLTTASTSPLNHPQRETEENTPHAQEQEVNLTSSVTTHSSVDDPPSARVNKTETPKGSQPAWAEQEENVSLPSGEHNHSDEEVLGTATPIQPSGHEQASCQPSGAELSGREVAAGRGNGKSKKGITAEAIQVYREAHVNRIGTPPTIHEKDRPILARLIEARSMQAYDGDIDQGNEEVCLNLMHYLKCEGKCENVGFSLEFFSKWYDVINMARIKGEVIDGYDHTWGEIKNMRSKRVHAELMAKHAAGDGCTFDQDGNPTGSPRSSFEAGYSHTTVAQGFVGGFREKFHRDITQEERERVMAIADRLGANPARDIIQHALSRTQGKDSEQFINTLCGDLIRIVA